MNLQSTLSPNLQHEREQHVKQMVWVGENYIPIICSKCHQGLVMLKNKGSIRTWIEEDKCM